MNNIRQTGMVAARRDLSALAYMLFMAKTAKPEAARRLFDNYAELELRQLAHLSRPYSPGSEFSKYNTMENAL